MSANTILASGAPFNVVFKANFDIQTTFGSQFQSYTTNIMGQPSIHRSTDDSLIYLSQNPVIGLSTVTAIVERPFVEESMPDEFQAGPNYMSTSLLIHIDSNLKIDNQSLINRPYELYIGYSTDTFADYELWITGKTIGGRRTDSNQLRLDLSTTSTKMQSLFPTTVFDNGVCSPYIYGAVDKIKPVLRIDGRYQFHTGAVNIASGSYKDITPNVFIDSDAEDYLGAFEFDLVDSASLSTSSTATDSLPSEITITGGKIRAVNGYVEVTIPDSSSDAPGVAPFQEYAVVRATPKDAGAGSLVDTAYYYDEWEIQLNPISTVSSYRFAPTAYTKATTLTKSESATIRSAKAYGDIDEGASFFFKKLDADDAEVVVVNVLSFRRVFIYRNESPAPIQVFDSSGNKFPTVRVGDASSIAVSELDGIAVYDDSGAVAVPEFMTGWSMDAVGSSVSDSVPICQSIATSAGITLTSTIATAGDQIGVYLDKQKTAIQHIRDIAAPLDYVEKTNLADDGMTLDRRFNNQPVDFDGNASNTTSFSITEDQIVSGSIRYNATKVGASRINVLINYNHSQPLDSDTVTDFNSRGVSTEVFTLATPLRGETPAVQLASLVGRQAVEREVYSMQIIGQGLGLRTNMVGTITHSDLRVGAAHIKNVKEVRDNTEIEVDVYV